MRTDDLVICLAYFSIPVQILLALYQYPRLAVMPWSVSVLIVLFALFVFFCGAGHALRCMELTHGKAFEVFNGLTAFISLATSLYLLPLVPSLMSSLDESLQSLKRLNQELEASKQKLMTFMAFLCHEIRNPLFVITSNLSFLEDIESSNQQNDDQDQALQAISQSADLMLRLVNDVLDISKLESGRLELQEQEFDLRGTLQGVGASMERFVHQKHGDNVFMKTRIEDNVPQFVYADSVRLLQIVYNLLSNANKFTEHGYIGFIVSKATPYELMDQGLDQHPRETRLRTGQYDVMEETEAYGDAMLGLLENKSSSDHEQNSLRKPLRYHRSQVYLKIRVQDTGMGIASDDLDQMFQPYAQAKLANYRKHGGTGLGLAIVAKLVTAMCGKVCAASEVGRGTTFDVYVGVQRVPPPPTDVTVSEQPQQASTHSKPAPVPVTSDPLIPVVPSDSAMSLLPSRHNMQPFHFPTHSGVVLVVEDNDDNQKILQRLLGQMNLETLVASDGQDAIEKLFKSRNFTLRAEDPEIGMVLMDLSMPIMDGYEATRVIRSHEVFRSLPIVALTAAATKEGEEQVIKAGCTEYQTKPIRREQLYQVCRRHLDDSPSFSTTTASHHQENHLAGDSSSNDGDFDQLIV